MKPRSAKNKGVRLQNNVAKTLAESFELEYGKDKDLQGREMGQSGTDIRMSRTAKKAIPFDIECKNKEKLNIWRALQQAEDNTEAGRIPLVVFKRNRSKTYAVLELKELLALLKNKELDNIYKSWLRFNLKS